MHFEKAAGFWQTAVVLSCLGYCLARERRDLAKALALCQEAVKQEPANPLHYLNLGRVYLLARQKHLAISSFRKGLRFGRHQGIVEELKKMGRRRRPVFRTLGRKHFLNRFFGSLLNKVLVPR
jgi:tetratricopeptide (TPR) repeat protein